MNGNTWKDLEIHETHIHEHIKNTGNIATYMRIDDLHRFLCVVDVWTCRLDVWTAQGCLANTLHNVSSCSRVLADC